MRWTTLAGSLTILLGLTASVPAGDGNRLTYLDEFCDPYWVGLDMPRLVTPQWAGQRGVRFAVVMAIDDMRSVDPYENHLRPILNRLEQFDGRAPVSIMTNLIDPRHSHLQKWLSEGLSLETHTVAHPCPCLTSKKPLAWSKQTYDRAVDMMSAIPGSRPVGFRMPCCDSMNSCSPRFFTEIFNRLTPLGNFLAVDVSVFHLYTPSDPLLPHKLVFDTDGRQKFRKYIPKDRAFVNFVEDYPYPYVIARLCWELPSMVPSDWQGYNLNQNSSPVTLADWKTAIDATAVKEGTFTLCFHPNQWMRKEMVVELVDYTIRKYGKKVKFFNLREVDELLKRNVLGGQPLRAANGQDNGVRILDLNNDGYMDAVIGNRRVRQTRTWEPKTGKWIVTDFPVPIVVADEKGNRTDTGVRFAVLRKNGFASVLVYNESVAGLWHFDGTRWVEHEQGLAGLEADGPVMTSAGRRDRGVRLRDVDGDGICELVVGNKRQNALFVWSAGRGGWKRLPARLPEGTAVVDAQGRDAGLRFVDLDVDGHADVVFSNARRYSVHLYVPATGNWSNCTISGERGQQKAVLPIVRADGSNNGAWFRANHMWVQNEQTGSRLANHVDRRHFTDLLGADREPATRSPEDSTASFDWRADLSAVWPLEKMAAGCRPRGGGADSRLGSGKPAGRSGSDGRAAHATNAYEAANGCRRDDLWRLPPARRRGQ